MIRPINFRPILFCALSLILGLILFRFSPSLKIWTFLLPIILFAIIFLIFYFFGEKNKRKIAFFTIGACLCFAFIGIALLGVRVSVTSNDVVKNGEYQINGVVDSVTYKRGKYYVKLKDCAYNGEKSGDLFIYEIDEEVGLYDVLSLKGYVYSQDKDDGKKISKSIISGQSMACSNYYDLQIVGKQKGVASWFKVKTDDAFKKALGDKFGIFSALLRGDVSEMKETVSTFRAVGIAHVFAVSGMHIGLVFTALSFILKKIPLNRYLKTAIVCFFLFFYSYLCGFTPSSLRASIMCSCIAIAKITGEKYDGVNALSEASIIVLTISPTELFSAGFILSFTICFSIIVLAPTFKNLFKFLPEEFSSSLSVLMSSQTAVIPLSVIFFDGFSLISFIANFLLLPVVTIIFYFLIIGVVICLILPINALIALFIPQILVVGTTGVISFLATIPLAITYFPTAFTVCYYSLMLCVSDFVNLPKKAKVLCGAVAFSLILLSVFIGNFTINA